MDVQETTEQSFDLYLPWYQSILQNYSPQKEGKKKNHDLFVSKLVGYGGECSISMAGTLCSSVLQLSSLNSKLFHHPRRMS
jgi:hypothetical protein